MIFGGRSLHDLSLSDFQLLIDNHVPEGPHLEYKEAAYSGRPADIREMLRDVTALANAEGGYLVMGIREDNYSRAAALSPIDDPNTKVQAINQACLDGIQERIPGLEVISYEIGFNQGIIVIRVPPSEQRPHMMVRDQSTDFVHRYGTDKRMMTLAEIRELVLANPRFRRLVELELLAQGQRPSLTGTSEANAPPFAQILTEHTVEHFLRRYLVSPTPPHVMVIVSPFISDLAGEMYELKDVLKRINIDRTRTYVVTRRPREAYQQVGMRLLNESPYVEIRYNPDIHAKLYVCWHREEEESFALFGSGNLTSGGLRYNLELGMMILARGHGKKLIRELYDWSANALRTRSERVKAIQALQ
jgi:hypothetical protein